MQSFHFHCCFQISQILFFLFLSSTESISSLGSRRTHGHGKALGLRAAINLVTYLSARPLRKGFVLSEDRTVQVRVLPKVRRIMV